MEVNESESGMDEGAESPLHGKTSVDSEAK